MQPQAGSDHPAPRSATGHNPEAVTNARRHAKDPTVVSVDLCGDGYAARLRVHDDGRPATGSRATHEPVLRAGRHAGTLLAARWRRPRRARPRRRPPCRSSAPTRAWACWWRRMRTNWTTSASPWTRRATPRNPRTATSAGTIAGFVALNTVASLTSRTAGTLDGRRDLRGRPRRRRTRHLPNPAAAASAHGGAHGVETARRARGSTRVTRNSTRRRRRRANPRPQSCAATAVLSGP